MAAHGIYAGITHRRGAADIDPSQTPSSPQSAEAEYIMGGGDVSQGQSIFQTIGGLAGGAVGAFQKGGALADIPTVFGFAAGGMGWLSLGMKAFQELNQNKAMIAEAGERARQMRAQGQAVLRQSRRQAQDVREEERFTSAEEARQLRNTGFLTGSKSLGEGTGLKSVFDSNQNAAENLANDIMNEANKQNEQYVKAAEATQRAAKERTKGNIFGRVLQGIGL